MLLGCTLVVIALVVYILRDPNAAWEMVFSWWRTPTSHVTRDPPVASPEQDALKKIEDNKKDSHDVVSTEDLSLTPKAKPATGGIAPPSLRLDDWTSDSSDGDDNMPAPQFPALNSAQRASSGTKPPIPSFTTTSVNTSQSSSTMPPPPRPAPSGGLKPPSLAPVPMTYSSKNSLSAPQSGPIPDRGPGKSSSSFTADLRTNATKQRRKEKVALTPGHSPLDWANLQRTHPNLAGVPGFQRVTPSVLRFHNGRKGRPAWASYHGRVYNITPYLPFHPGGERELLMCAGRDGEKLFSEVHPWVNWDNMLEQCLVGILVSENDPRAGKHTL